MGQGSEEMLADELLALLLDATRIRLRADVPVGAYLSGGLDSTFVTALAKKLVGHRLKTFSVTFDDPQFDEGVYQREAASFLGTEHYDVHCANRDIARVFPDVIWHTEQPILRTAPAPLFVLSKLVRDNGFKVVLTGEGSDETMGGYDIFKETKIRRFWQRQPHSAARPLLLRRLYPYMESIQQQPSAYLENFFRIGEGSPGPFFSHLPRWQLTAKAKLFFSAAVRSDLGGYDALDELQGLLPESYYAWEAFLQAQYLETNHLLPGYILSSQGDRVAMAHAVEGRFPFLDYRVVEFAAKLPIRMKMKVLQEKYLLKRCAEGLIPRSVQSRPKQPYRAPDALCFLEPEAREYVDELLAADCLRRYGIFEPGPVAKLFEKVRSGRPISVRDNMALVGIVSTQLLIDQFVHTFNRRTWNANQAGVEAVRS
jgi:asparagine synthase (glutamine-hydrolysing)